MLVPVPHWLQSTNPLTFLMICDLIIQIFQPLKYAINCCFATKIHPIEPVYIFVFKYPMYHYVNTYFLCSPLSTSEINNNVLAIDLI